MQLIWARTSVYFAVVTSVHTFILRCHQSEVLLYRYVFLKMTRASRGIALSVLDAKNYKIKVGHKASLSNDTMVESVSM